MNFDENIVALILAGRWDWESHWEHEEHERDEAYEELDDVYYQDDMETVLEEEGGF